MRTARDRAAARRRRRRQGQMRLAVAVALLVVVIVLVVLAVRGCGDDPDQAGAPQGTAASPSPQGASSPRPVSSTPPLVGLGDTVRFQTPEGAVVRVRVSGYRDPGEAPAGVTADPGERLVTLQFRVIAEGAEGGAAVSLPFSKADSFILVAEDDKLIAAQVAGDGLLGAELPPGERVTVTLAFSVGAAAPVRFVCTPVDDSRPRSATWNLTD